MLNYKKSNPKIGCRDIAEIVNIGKTSVATIIKNEEKLRKDYASFEGNRKRIRQGKFYKLNEAMYLWYTKCCAANLYPTVALIREEALLMKEKMIETNPELDGFHASNGWLESFKITYGIRETTTVISKEAGDVPITTVKAWMERLPELVKGYSLEDAQDMDELGLFLKTLPQKGLVEKGKKGRGGKQSKKRCTVALFVATNGSKVCDLIVVWRSKKPRCFEKLRNIYHPHGVNYFANAKAWMTTEIIQEVLKMLDKKIIAKGRNVLLFLDNAPSRPNILQEALKNIKLEFFPKNTASRLQPCDAGIIKNFKHKYRKLLIRYILARIDSVNRTAREIIKDVTILKVIEWIQTSWADVSEKTIKNCFEKCGFGNPNVVADETVDHEFEELLQELSSDVTVEEFLEFDDCDDTCEPEVNTSSVDWREELQAKCIQSVTNQNVEPDDNCSESKENEEHAREIDSKSAVNSGEALAMLDKLHVFF